MKSLYSILLLLISLTACKKDGSLWRINNLNQGQIFVFGHGGSGSKYRFPMNSMQSLNNILETGVYGTEMDVQLTQDNELILFHNFRLEDATTGQGLVRERTAEEVKQCKYKFSPLNSGARVISASQFFNQRGHVSGFHYVFDTKIGVDASASEIADFSQALYALIKTYKLQQNSFIESYNVLFLQALQNLDSDLKLFIHSDSYSDGLAASKQLKLYGLTMDRTRITKEEIAAAHGLNLRIALFNLDTEKENLEAIDMSPDYLQSDDCAYALEALK